MALLTAAAAATTPARGILVVATAESPDVTADIPVAGLPLLRRIALAASRAGFARVLVQDDGPAAAALLDGTSARALSTEPAPAGRWRIVVLARDVVPQPQWLRGILEAAIVPETLHADGGAVAVVDSDDAAGVLGLLRDARSAGAMLATLRRRFPAVERAFEPRGRFRLTGAGDVAKAEDWLLRGLIKQNEGFMSRHVERRASLAVTRRLAATAVTPNVMTLVSVAIGLAAAPFFLSPSPLYQFPGALLFLLHSIVDGCDGELARLKFRESRAGAILDFWGDNVVHVAVFGCIAVGWALAEHAPWPLVVGGVSLASTLGAAAAVSHHTMRDAPAAAGSLTGRLVGALAHRDFIYVVIVLSALGKASWFLVLSATGTPLFLLLLLLTSAARAPSTDCR
jgi:phosphatidylglycerophosphate synthase